MSLALFYDTETTGLPLWKEPSGDPRQPHLVQLAALLVDLEMRQVVEELDLLIKPEGWIIPDDVVAVHGITTAHALEHGIHESTALDRFMALHELADERIAHVESFDARLLRIALKRYRDDAAADAWKAGPSQCTAKLSSPICQLPLKKPSPWSKFKTPNLTEAFEFFTGGPMAGAHSAMADTRACMTVFFGVQDHQAKEAEKAAA